MNPTLVFLIVIALWAAGVFVVAKVVTGMERRKGRDE